VRLSDKVALVTGGGNGMGKAHAMGLAREGAKVVVVDVDLGAAEAVSHEICAMQGVALPAQCDVADASAIERVVDQAIDHYGGIDILVNNAARHLVRWSGPFSSFGAEQLDDLFRVNVFGIVNMIQACSPSMATRGGGAIVNISSTNSYPSREPYGVTKLTVRGLTTAFARELGPNGIRVNCIAPGIIFTTTTLADADMGEAFLDDRRAGQVLDMRGSPEDVVETMLFLVSGAARFITGQTIRVDGGLVLLP
jgi:3-oxoacyl-[acyl-carrier protein] reductase